MDALAAADELDTRAPRRSGELFPSLNLPLEFSPVVARCTLISASFLPSHRSYTTSYTASSIGSRSHGRLFACWGNGSGSGSNARGQVIVWLVNSSAPRVRVPSSAPWKEEKLNFATSSHLPSPHDTFRLTKEKGREKYNRSYKTESQSSPLAAAATSAASGQVVDAVVAAIETQQSSLSASRVAFSRLGIESVTNIMVGGGGGDICCPRAGTNERYRFLMQTNATRMEMLLRRRRCCYLIESKKVSSKSCNGTDQNQNLVAN